MGSETWVTVLFLVFAVAAAYLALNWDGEDVSGRAAILALLPPAAARVVWWTIAAAFALLALGSYLATE